MDGDRASQGPLFTEKILSELDEQHRVERWWRDVATWVAVGGLILAIIFNTMSVRQGNTQAKLQSDQARRQAAEARKARLHTEIGVLTSLSAYLKRTDIALARTPVERHHCDPAVPLSERDRLKVLAQVASYDYLAWLFNRRLWKLSAAETYWSRSMLKALEFAEDVYESPGINKQFAELVRFREALPGAPSEVIPCR